jgi:tetratricopeptide (TPR) repeat protein
LLEEAVAVLRAALEERTREADPLDWAMTQYNLGNALQALGAQESSPSRLEEAVVAYRAALLERTRTRVPLKWARTCENMAIAVLVLLRLTGLRTHRAQALEAVEDALAVHRDAQSAHDIAKAEALRTQILAAAPAS